MKQIYINGAKGDGLAGWHMKSRANETCTDCHGSSGVVDDSATDINARCTTCHGNEDELAKKTAAKRGDINPHKSHMGSIACTSCHAGHTASFPYCQNCHSFTMPIAFGGAKPQWVPTDFSLYAKAKPNRVEKTDIVIVGAGGSGVVAAIEARAQGKSVILLEQMPIIGGSSLLSAGGMNAAGTKVQKSVGVLDDTPQIMFDDTMRVGRNANDPELVRFLAEQSNAALEWFQSLGGELTVNPNSSGAGGTKPRTHFTKIGGIGRYMFAVFRTKLETVGASVRINSEVVRLNTDKDGRVTGVLVKGKYTGLYEVQAGATILATGSFANNQALITRTHPELAGAVTSAQPGALGAGIVLGEAIGAKLIDMDGVQIHPTVAKGTTTLVSQQMRTTGGILVNSDGKRFVNDTDVRSKVGAAILAQPGKSAFLIFDDSVAKARQALVDGYRRLGFLKVGTSIGDLAKQTGIPPAALEKTLKDYADYHANKKDPEFGRASIPQPLTNGNRYAIEVVPAVGGSLGGLVIDTTTQVIGTDGKPIRGLFASGETTGGVHGKDRYGGNAVAQNIVFGRTAAASAVKFINQR